MTRFRGRALVSALLLICSLAAFSQESVGIKAALDDLGAFLRWDPLSRICALETASHRVVFEVASGPPSSSDANGAASGRFCVLDGTELLTVPLPYLEGSELKFPKSFITAVGAAFSKVTEKVRPKFRIAAVIVDPGHGGRDSGATAVHSIDGKRRTLVEKDIVLKVAKDLHAKLAETYADKRILLTRSGDTYPTLEQRVEAANSVSLAENEAIVFVSVHANASFNKNARGYEVWYLSPEYRRTVLDADRYSDSADVLPILNTMMEEEYTTESIMIARSIMDEFGRIVGKKSPARGIKAEEWFVVRNARMPSVLVEIGFITNSEDAALLASDAYLRKLSEAIYSGIKDFITKFERTGGFTAVR
ncbi:MAG: N-acetylmuramoyl-L-alanine amidase [Treponemataceae bacterium]